ncbi:MAG: hypothetical protein ACRC8Y_01175 [Chroococcales cyanobacterium]
MNLSKPAKSDRLTPTNPPQNLRSTLYPLRQEKSALEFTVAEIAPNR